jgi:hypothetical protein
MRAFHSNRGITSLQVGAVVLAALLLFFFVAFVYRHEDSTWLKTALEESARKTRLVQTMKSELLASAEAEKSSVMADTDEASTVFAEESIQASQNVERARIELKALTKENSREANLLQNFSSCWEKLREVDKEVLSLAVQNTNLKALRLSFVPAAAAMRRMEEALNQLMDLAAPSPHAAGIIRLASKALTGALSIYALEAPHIAETTDARMDRIEANMKQLDGQVRESLNNLDDLMGESGKLLNGEARQSYQEFQAINSEIIDLSRQNSNIRSFAVSLGQKRNAMAQCLDLLNALQDSVREGAEVKATR